MNAVSPVAGWGLGVPRTPGIPWQATELTLPSTVGEVTSIITTAVKDVATAIGGLATDAFAIRDGARQARAQLDEDSD